MKNRYFIICLMGSIGICLCAFIGNNKYFNISKQDVTLIIPKHFPKPFYTFKGNKLTPEAFTLGRKLFYDPILSKDSTISCASCHQRIAAFGHIDHPLSHGINGLIGKRNVPALQNLIWKDAFMWDGGVNHLEVQPISPLTNPIEMNETLASIIAKLRNNKEYVSEFRLAFKDTVISSAHLLKALTQFTGLMISSNSRYDKYINGEDTFLSAEKHGLILFRSKCATCHTEPLFTNNQYANNGLPPDTALKDKGRGTITGLETDNYKFKVPSLRNIERTYPYMHDGRFRTLKDVLNHYATSAKFPANVAKEVHDIGTLTDNDKKDIITFLLTLTDKTFLTDRRFVDPFMQ